MPKKQRTGIVVSDKMQKTVIVQAERLTVHPKYKRRMKVHERYKAHDEANEYKTGDKVVIEEASPISREKRWRVLRRI